MAGGFEVRKRISGVCCREAYLIDSDGHGDGLLDLTISSQFGEIELGLSICWICSSYRIGAKTDFRVLVLTPMPL